jgi:ferredoxin
MPRVTFLPSGRAFEIGRGGSLFRAVLRARLPLARSCRGVGVCGLCNVRVVAGEAALSAATAAEVALVAREGLGGGQRIACLARVLGDVTIATGYW